MYCPKCREEYYDMDDIFCSNCGTKLIDNPVERLSMRVKSSNVDFKDDLKLDTIINQNKQLIKQNEIIINLLKRLVI